MKIIIATLLFISATEAIRNLVDLPEERSSRLHQLLKDGPIDPKQLTNPYNSKTTTARIAALFTKGPLNDHESGSGEPEPGPEPGPAPGPDPLKTLAESILHIGPALNELKEDRDQKSKGKAFELLYTLKYKGADEVKKLLGKHAIEQHKHCNSVKWKFANYVHQAVLDELLKDKDDILDFPQDLHEAFEYASMSSEVDVFEAFTYVVDKHNLRDHPGIKAIIMIGGLIADAGCDEKLDGLFKILGQFVEYVDPYGEYDLSDRFNLAIYSKQSPVCRPGYADHHHAEHHHGPTSGIRHKFLDLINRPDCKEVNFMRYIVDTVVEGIEVAHKFSWLHRIAKGLEHAVIQHVEFFMQRGHEDLAYKVLGKYILDNVRGALTVGLAVEKRFAPKPSGSKPTTTSSQSTTEGAEVSTTEGEAGSTTEAPEVSTTEGEAGSTTEAPEVSTTEGEAGSTTEAPVEEKRVLRHHNRRMHRK